MKRSSGSAIASSSTPRKSDPTATKKPSPSSDLDFDPQHRIGHLLRRAYHRAKNTHGALLKDLGVTPVQAAAMMTLYAHGSTSQAELGRLIDMEATNVRGLVGRLAALGLIAIDGHPSDSRQNLVTTTRKGDAAAIAIAGMSAQASAKTLEPLSADERETFITLLRRIALA